VEELGTEVAGRAAPGQVSIVGHTDAEASDAYNDDLSRRRAQAVADVLSPILAPAGVTLVVEGRGEREPVADNATPEGRQLNRRVSVGFTEEAS
jgi:OOP family OmpA-OmpF porin